MPHKKSARSVKKKLPRHAKMIPAKRTKQTQKEDTIRMWWTGLAVVLLLVLVLDFAMHAHTEFGIEGTRFFHAWYGFMSCAGIIVLSKALGGLLKRPENYYGEK